MAISSALFVTPLVAQPLDTDANKPFENNDAQRVETVTVTGTKRIETKQDAAQSIEAFREADVRNVFDAFDVLSKAANVTTSSRSALPTVRGLDGNGVAYGGGGAVSGGRPRFTTYVDGVPRAYSFTVDGSASLWDVQQIEVYRGSQSTTLGRNSIAGAMVVTTRDPMMKNEFAVEAGLRSARATWSAAAMANIALGERSALRLTAEGIHGENPRTTAGPGLAGISSSQLERQDFERFRAKWLITPSALPDLTLRLTHDREKTAAPFPVDSVTLQNASLRESDPTYYAFFIKNNETTSLQASYVINTQWTADAVLSEQRSQNLGPSPVPGSPAFLNVFANSRERTFEPKLSYRAASGRTSAVIGAFFFDRNRIEGGSPGSGFEYDAVDTAKTQSVYGDVRWQLSEKWDLLGGARWERENQKRKFDAALGLGLQLDETANVFLPKTGVEYHLSRDVSVGGLLYKG
jgi:iron complex outermembrane recepter protein